MSKNTLPARSAADPHSRRRAAAGWRCGAALTLLFGAAALGGAACSASSAPSSPPAETPSIPASTGPSGQGEAVQAAFLGYVKTLTAMYQSASPSQDWDKYAALDAANQATSDVGQFRAHGIIVRGAVRVSKLSTPSIAASSPPSASMTVCWDTTGEHPVYAATGKSAVPPGSTPPPPALATVTFEDFPYGWRVTKLDTTGTTPC